MAVIRTPHANEGPGMRIGPASLSGGGSVVFEAGATGPWVRVEGSGFGVRGLGFGVQGSGFGGGRSSLHDERSRRSHELPPGLFGPLPLATVHAKRKMKAP